MCRLFALKANEPTRVECGLVRSQNALMRQSARDAEGLMNGHGWGVADFKDGLPLIERQTWAAFHGEHFTKTAARVYAKTVIAHVRRATVGEPSIKNTHPFALGRFIFAHNGTVPGFEQVRERLLERTDPLHRTEIKGQTDSEHVFHYLMTLWSRGPQTDMLGTVKQGLEQVIAWCAEVAPGRPVGLNIVLTDGERMIGSRLNRSLWFLERREVTPCPICGETHLHHHHANRYRAVEVASEPLNSNDDWKGVPDGTVFEVDPDYALHFVPLRLPA